jgi:epoxyqueuosine reductase
MTQEGFSLRFRGSPLKRTKRAGLVRNAAVVLGNAGDRGNLALLGETLQSHDEPLVRGHAAWAIGRLGGATAALLLERARAMEEDLYVRDEIAAAEASR